ncbi:acetyl-CoA carboxylase carboxyl transferase subunit beta [bacterium]|nr:acetyl-CoA carboxylase carboxyl transferase subunit beta [bacterium]|tara:strand:- start:938 stop:1801 length:864 start_codon:yes stop_codon:yes gene_type:complete
MSILGWFAKRDRIISRKKGHARLDIPSDLWVKCFSCDATLYLKELEQNNKVCHECQYHFRLSPEERLNYFFDRDSFEEYYSDIKPKDFLGFKDTHSYASRIEASQKKTQRSDAAVVGTAKIENLSVNVGLMDFAFMGGSMGCVVGEKITLITEMAIKNKRPLVVFTSSGGARMQEGIMSLMQMAKTSAALAKLSEVRVPYICVLCDPTTGGTSASFGMLGDVTLAEPGALISFAGPRVIEQTIRQKLPPGFQRSEFLLENGMVDRVVHRKEMRSTVAGLVRALGGSK